MPAARGAAAALVIGGVTCLAVLGVISALVPALRNFTMKRESPVLVGV